MDPVTAAFIFILGLGLGSEVNNTNEDVSMLEKQVNKLEETVFRLAGSHASLSARKKVDDEDQNEQIGDLYDRLDYLDDKINILHP